MKGKKIMKKMILMAVAMLSMTTAMFADNEAKKSVEATYSLNINIDALSNTLEMSSYQEAAIADAHKSLSADLMNAAAIENAEARKNAINLAVGKDLQAARKILSLTQYHDYLKLLNTTLNNRGLLK